MRDRRGTLTAYLTQEKGAGDNADQLLYGLKRKWKESPCPSDVTSWMNKPAVDVNGNSHNEELSSEMKNGLSEVSLLLHDGNSTLPLLQESVRRNLAAAAAQSKTVDLPFASAEEHFAGVLCGGREAQGRDWLGGGPRATDSHRGRDHKGAPWDSGPACYQKRSEMGISEDELPGAFLERLDSELEPSCLRSVLSLLLHAHPQIVLNDETKCVFPSHSKPVFSEQTVEYKKVLSRMKSTSDDLQVTLASLA